ncbi:MAG TPA: STAS domain-containing protein [Acidimicrobiales bacterium]|nr:STAS domain-containing protein [Acidimicrobiales bacterium]
MEPTEPQRRSHDELGDNVTAGTVHAPPVSIERRQVGATGVMVISGELGLEGGDAVEVAVAELVADGVSDVSVDAGSLTFVDSSGLGGLLAARALVVDAGGTFRFGPATENVARLIDLAGVHDLLGPEAT